MTWKKFVLAVLVIGGQFGCPPEAVESPWIKIEMEGYGPVTGLTVEANAGDTATFYADWGIWVDYVAWTLNQGQVRGPVVGHEYTDTFVNTTGHPITYKLSVVGYRGDEPVVTEEVFIKVNPFDGGDGGAIPDLVWVDGGLIIVGGVWKDGVIEVVLGQTLRLDGTNFVRGGQNPLTVYWLSSSGAQLGLGPTWNLLCDRVGRTEIILRVVDGRGKVIEKVIVIVVVDPGGGGSNALLPAIDFKINDSAGLVTIAANEDGMAIVQASWGSSNALRVDMSGAPDWQGERALQGNEEITLFVGTLALKATATNAQGWTVADTVTVTVTPYQNPNQPPVGDLVVTITAPADWQSFALNQNVDFAVSVNGGTPPFTVHWMFYDGENIFGNTSARSWTHRKKLETKATDWVQNAVQVSDSGGRVSAPIYLNFKVP